jgi:D-alanine-D-alanine ligase
MREGKPILIAPDPEIKTLLPLSEISKSSSTTIQEQPLDRQGEISRALDVVFPVLHGRFGEDGTIQGLLELAGIPYVSGGVLASAVGMDKDVMKRLFREAGLPIVKFLTFRVEELQDRSFCQKEIARKIGYPCFVKPANSGSSVGIRKVHKSAELNAALDEARQFDEKILVEEGIEGREIECSVLGNDDPVASLAGEIIPAHEFYDYEAKYIDEGSRLVIPAKITKPQLKRVQQLAVDAFKAVDGAGMARVDFFLQRKTGRVLLNELNTIPGFTKISMYPKLWEASGISYAELIDRLIQLAFERHAKRSRLKTTHD